jgi:hypothetical protein
MSENKQSLDSQSAPLPLSVSPAWQSLPKLKIGQPSRQNTQRQQQIQELKRLIYKLETMD